MILKFEFFMFILKYWQDLSLSYNDIFTERQIKDLGKNIKTK